MALGFIPGMPNIAFLIVGAATLYAGWWLGKQTPRTQAAADAATGRNAATRGRGAAWDDVVPVDVLRWKWATA